ERSMLGVFQEVAIQILENNIGHLATFDLMFAGLRTALKTQIQDPIRLAENNLDNLFAVKLLKALFLVKYIKDFKGTAKNLRILMLDGFNNDIKVLTRQVEEALDLLVQKSYLQRNGEEYEFLTREEKDIEHEIKATEVDLSEAADELAKIAFDQILKIQKVHYTGNDHNYPFGRKMDNQLYGREQDLSIHIFSPFNDNDEKTVKTQSIGRDELLVMMPPDKRLWDDLLLLKRTDKYIRQNVTITQKDSVRHILSEKTSRNRERLQNLQQQIRTILCRAKLVIAGQEIEELSEDPQTRVTNACQKLITRTYPNLAMLPGINFTEKHILEILRAKQPSLSGLSEAEQEMFSFIQSNKRTGIRTTVKILVDKFEGKPHGWYLMAIICTLAKLCSLGKIEVRADSTLLDDSKLEQALKNTRSYANLILEPQAEFTTSQIRALKEFFNDFFERPPQNHDAKTLALEAGQALQELKENLTGHYNQSKTYPFLANLKEPLAAITEITGKPYAFYLTELLQKEDDLLDLKESIIDPLIRFMEGSQKTLYDEVKLFISSQKANFPYIKSDALARLESLPTDPLCFKNNTIQQVRPLIDTVKEKISSEIEKEKKKAADQLEILKTRLTGLDAYAVLPSEIKENAQKIFTNCRNTLNQQSLIAMVNDTIRRFEELEYPDCLNLVTNWTPPVLPVPPTSPDYKTKPATTPGNTAEATIKPIKTINKTALNVTFNKPWLVDENDIENYLSTLKKAMLQEIKNGKRIQI
ncbi:MAG: BREX system P-loop protein BrxC, partial [Desulfobacterales bacterium]|nr:BREX system P-loop protein BrxC [Desulfobacterales bacterium]